MGRLDLKDGAIVYVDTAPIIYSVERHPKYIDLLQPLWTKVNNNEISLFSSELLWLEILVKPLKANNQSIIDLYTELLTSSIQLAPVDESILRSAAQLRSTTKLKTPDAIHAATAMSCDCTIFLTNDRGFQNTPRLPVVILDQVIQS